MSESIFDRLADDWRAGEQHLGSWFHRHARHDGSPASAGDTITAEAPQTTSPAGAPVPLADTSAALDSDITSIRAGLQNALAAGHDVLDNLVSQLDQHASDVRLIAAIADAPIVVAAAGALHVPAPILDGITMMLNAVAAEHARPVQEAPAEPAQPAAEVPQEAQPEQPAAA